MKLRRRTFLLFWLVLLLSLTTTAFAARPTTLERLRELGGVPCPDSAFTCVTITVPLDHFNPSDKRTLDVVFAVLPANGARKGMFVTVTGGPGTAGIACCADYYTTFFAPSVTEHFDIVFFDQRGVGLSGGIDCYQAAAQYYQADWRTDTPAREQKLKNAARSFADECDAEMGHPEFLPYLGTKQAVEDLELFRQLIGDPKLWLYGESYGTQYAQQYGKAHANRLAGLILDGTVDLTLDGVTYYARAAQSFNDTLVGALAQCEANPKCLADYGIKPLKAYDKLARLLQGQRQVLSFPLGNGTRVTRKFDLNDLDTTGEGQMYSQGPRMLFVRALAAYSRDGDLVPLARLLYPDLGIDETTLKPSYDPTWSDAFYYGVECQDYGYFKGTRDARADQYVAKARPVELSGVRLAAQIWGDFPCVYWRESSQDTTRPPYFKIPGVTTFVLNALADPITPIAGARAVYEHLDNAYLITQRGGPHVIFGREVPCIDDLVTAFLVNDEVPAQRETECGGKVMFTYVPLAPRDARDFSSLLATFNSVETEINLLPEYWDWDYTTTTRVGCPLTGTLKFRAVENRAEYVFKDCSFSKGFVLSGDGTYRFGRDRFVLNVNVKGYRQCHFIYERKGDQSSVQGNCPNGIVNESSGARASEIEKEIARPSQRRWMRH